MTDVADVIQQALDEQLERLVAKEESLRSDLHAAKEAIKDTQAAITAHQSGPVSAPVAHETTGAPKGQPPSQTELIERELPALPRIKGQRSEPTVRSLTDRLLLREDMIDIEFSYDSIIAKFAELGIDVPAKQPREAMRTTILKLKNLGTVTSLPERGRFRNTPKIEEVPKTLTPFAQRKPNNFRREVG